MTKKLIVENFSLVGGAINWTAPDGVGMLESASGRGENGYAPSTEYVAQYDEHTTTHVVDPQGLGTVIDNGVRSDYGPTPQDYCTPPQPFGEGSTVSTCYDYTDTSYAQDVPGYDGQDTTGFGQIFPGGLQANAVAQGYAAVPVVPNQSYSLYVASGGFLTITYWK